jgi:catechol 2,3-dioxygenase-like lactoylglutathione lyase family enzyme
MIHHVQIAIPAGGEAQARNFYGKLLGLTEVAKPENLQKRGGVWFATGTLQLHVGVDPGFQPAKKAHVAYQVENVATLRARPAAAGYPCVDDEPLAGFERFYTEDPFGNRVEIIAPRQSGF